MGNKPVGMLIHDRICSSYDHDVRLFLVWFLSFCVVVVVPWLSNKAPLKVLTLRLWGY